MPYFINDLRGGSASGRNAAEVNETFVFIDGPLGKSLTPVLLSCQFVGEGDQSFGIIRTKIADPLPERVLGINEVIEIFHNYSFCFVKTKMKECRNTKILQLYYEALYSY